MPIRAGEVDGGFAYGLGGATGFAGVSGEGVNLTFFTLHPISNNLIMIMLQKKGGGSLGFL
ncbi:MAG: hypothetical protein H7835_20145 [Magnetococcus sp. XQGC-1]